MKTKKLKKGWKRRANATKITRAMIHGKMRPSSHRSYG